MEKEKNLAVCKLVINKKTGEVTVDRETLTHFAVLSCAVADKTILSEGAKEVAENLEIPKEIVYAVETLVRDAISFTAATITALLTNPEEIKNITKILGDDFTIIEEDEATGSMAEFLSKASKLN